MFQKDIHQLTKINLKRNCLLRLETSMVSMSTTWMCRNPDKACVKKLFMSIRQKNKTH